MRNVAVILLSVVLGSAKAAPEAVRETLLMKKDISDYAGSDMALTVRELEFPPGFEGTKHRHPGPVFVCVLDGSLEIELEGNSPKTYRQGQCFAEEPHQLHVYSRNASKTEPVRLISYVLTRNGEPLVLPEKN